MDEEEAQVVRLHVKGLGANVSALVERNKAIERENRSLRARVSELEAAQVVNATHLRENAATQTDFPLVLDTPPGSPQRGSTTHIGSVPSSPPSSPQRVEPAIPDQPEVPVQETFSTNVTQPIAPHQDKADVTPAESIAFEEDKEIRSSPSQQDSQPADEGYLARLHVTNCTQIPIGLAEALDVEPDAATAAAMGTACLVSPEQEDRNWEEENCANQCVSRPGMLPSLWHVLARRGRLPPRHQLNDHIIRSTPAAPSDGGRGLGFMLGDVVVRDPV